MSHAQFCLVSHLGCPIYTNTKSPAIVTFTCHDNREGLYRVVQLNLTPEIEVFHVLFDRSRPIFRMTSLKQHMSYFNFRCSIQLDRPVLPSIEFLPRMPSSPPRSPRAPRRPAAAAATATLSMRLRHPLRRRRCLKGCPPHITSWPRASACFRVRYDDR